MDTGCIHGPALRVELGMTIRRREWRELRCRIEWIDEARLLCRFVWVGAGATGTNQAKPDELDDALRRGELVVQDES